jgi:hypothetical protein
MVTNKDRPETVRKDRTSSSMALDVFLSLLAGSENSGVKRIFYALDFILVTISLGSKSSTSEEKIATVMHEFIDAVNKKDVEKAVSCFQDDATWQTAEGTFKGKSEREAVA